MISGLDINFGEQDYSIREDLPLLSSPITLQFRNNQNPFNVTLMTWTIDRLEMEGVGFINPTTIGDGERATAGILMLSHIFTFHNNTAIY